MHQNSIIRDSAESEPTISAIVPARNEEATIAAAIESLAAQPEITEIFAVNDQSTDGTAAELARLAIRYPQLHVIQSEALPDGWVGKNLAVSQGAAKATGDWLLFVDADGVLLPAAVSRALADAKTYDAGLVSYSPEQETRTWYERALIPFIYVRLGHKFSFDEVNDPASPAAAANGQFLMIRREDYERIGGHASVRDEVLEDVALAHMAKQAGIRLHFASGHGIMRVRMYRSFGAMWQGWVKNLYPLMGRTSRAVGRELRSIIPWIPLLLLFLTPMNLILGGLGAAMILGRHASYAAELRRNRIPAARALYYVPAVVLYSAALLTSEWHYKQGSVSWKGRAYAVKPPDSKSI
jgi:glycosyltransferase involved in cell wall biosynthesis